MRKLPLIALASVLLAPIAGFAQTNVTLPDISPGASVTQTIGITDVTVKYHRPSVLKRDIWGKLVPYGFNNLGFGTSKAAPWRAGANETTVITFTSDVTIEGSPLKAGSYGLFMAPAEDGTVTVIFSKDTGTWGSFFYDEANDVLRVTSKLVDSSFHEQLVYSFSDVTKDSATLALIWEKKRIPIAIKVDTDQVVLASLKEELRGSKGFKYQAWVEASNYLLKNDLDLPLALQWADFAISDSNFGTENFATLSNKADILDKMGRADDASKVMDSAMKYATVIDIHLYGRKLLANHNTQKALEIFKLNAQLHPDVWPVNFGLARAYSAVGDYKSALEAAIKAQPQVPAGDSANAAVVAQSIERLKKGEDINK
jgi:hypothetical protein